MSAILGIFGSPITEIELFDLQNGAYTIDILESATYSAEPLEIELGDGNKVRKGYLIKLEFSIQVSDSAILDELKKRLSVKQTIQAKSLDSKVTIDDVFIQLNIKRGFSSGNPHIIQVLAQKIEEE